MVFLPAVPVSENPHIFYIQIEHIAYWFKTISSTKTVTEKHSLAFQFIAFIAPFSPLLTVNFKIYSKIKAFFIIWFSSINF